MMALAQRNKVPIPYAKVDEIRRAYDFSDLQSFLDIYYAGAQVLKEEQEFYDLTGVSTDMSMSLRANAEIGTPMSLHSIVNDKFVGVPE